MASIKEFYANRSVFITGATGFIGKVLLEKLLRSCPKMDKVYVLIRKKKGKTPEERVKSITSIPLFDKLKEEYPNAINEKIQPVLGDVEELRLGLSEVDVNILIENVSVVFHGAASVRFDDNLKHAILLNTRGAREVVNLALTMKKIQAFLHVSTTYCNVDRNEVDEQLYPAHADWRQAISIAENVDEHVLQALMLKYVDVLPNTYTFTKSMAEHCIYDLCKNIIPTVIIRPSIVLASRYDPIPGWIDNFNGPVGIMVGITKGIMRSVCANPDVNLDYVPVDTVVRGLLLAAWDKATTKDLHKKLVVSFYNCSNNGMYTVTMKQFVECGIKMLSVAPMNNVLWYPRTTISPYKFWYYINFVLFNLLPAVAVDTVLKLLNKKPVLVNIQRHVYIANIALYHFMTHQWSFPHFKCLALEDKLLPEEKEEFSFDRYHVNMYKYVLNYLVHGRRYLLNDNASIETAKRKMYRMYILDKVCQFLLVTFLFWVLIYMVNIVSYLDATATAVYESLLI